jgi:hypothetical protein
MARRRRAGDRYWSCCVVDDLHPGPCRSGAHRCRRHQVGPEHVGPHLPVELTARGRHPPGMRERSPMYLVAPSSSVCGAHSSPEKRSQADCFEMRSAWPISAQLHPCFRAWSTVWRISLSTAVDARQANARSSSGRSPHVPIVRRRAFDPLPTSRMDFARTAMFAPKSSGFPDEDTSPRAARGARIFPGSRPSAPTSGCAAQRSWFPPRPRRGRLQRVPGVGGEPRAVFRTRGRGSRARRPMSRGRRVRDQPDGGCRRTLTARRSSMA